MNNGNIPSDITKKLKTQQDTCPHTLCFWQVLMPGTATLADDDNARDRTRLSPHQSQGAVSAYVRLFIALKMQEQTWAVYKARVTPLA